MAINLNDFNKAAEQAAGDTSKQVKESRQQLDKDIQAEEQRRQDEYDKAQAEAQRKSMGPLTALIKGDFGRFGEALIENDPIVQLAKGDISGAVNSFVDASQEAGTVLLNTVGQLAFGLGPTVAAAINTGVDSVQEAANDKTGFEGKANTSMSVQTQAGLAKVIGDPNASAEEKAMAGAQMLSNAASFIPAAGAGAAAARTILQSAPQAVQAGKSIAQGDMLGAGLQGAAIAGNIAGAVKGGGSEGGGKTGIGVQEVLQAGTTAASGVSDFIRTGNADNLVNSVSGSVTGLMGDSKAATGINYTTSILTGNANKVGAQIAGTSLGNVLRDPIQDSFLGTGDKRVTEETVQTNAEEVQAAEAENARREAGAKAAAVPATDGTWTVTANGVPQTFASQEEAEKFAADNAVTSPDTEGEAVWNAAQDAAAEKALQDYRESEEYKNLPEDLKEQAEALFKGEGGALNWTASASGSASSDGRQLVNPVYGKTVEEVKEMLRSLNITQSAGHNFSKDQESFLKSLAGFQANDEALTRFIEASQKGSAEFNRVKDEWNDERIKDGYTPVSSERYRELDAPRLEYERAKKEGSKSAAELEILKAAADESKAATDKLFVRIVDRGEDVLPTMLEKSIEINPYQREAYTGTQTVTPEIQFTPGIVPDYEPVTVEPEYKTVTTDNSAKLSQVTPDYVPDPVIPVPQDIAFNPEYGWNYTGTDYTGGNQSIGFKEQEAYAPETIVDAPQREEPHNWVEYINNQYGTPLVYSDEQLKVKYFTIPHSKKLRETFRRLAEQISKESGQPGRSAEKKKPYRMPGRDGSGKR